MRDLHQIMKDIQPYIDFIFEHEDEFLRSFAEADSDGPFCLIEVYFGSGEIKFAYDLWSGKGASDAITIKGFVSWMRKTRGEYP